MKLIYGLKQPTDKIKIHTSEQTKIYTANEFKLELEAWFSVLLKLLEDTKLLQILLLVTGNC